MRKVKLISVLGIVIGLSLIAAHVWSAYYHAGESDAPKFLAAYPDKAGSKLDQCNTCHTGGSYVSGGKTTTLGSCQWCHYKYGYDRSGNITATLNVYGKAYYDNGRTAAALKAIENLDSDGDGFTNIQEINALSFPGNANDYPGMAIAPYRIFTRTQLLEMAQHKQFLLMNTTKSGDYYAEYSGITLQDLLARAGMTSAATGINVYSPDGFSAYHPLSPDPSPSLYHAIGLYPAATYYYDMLADPAKTIGGWCDYSAPSNAGRANGDSIVVEGGLQNMLAMKRDGALLDTGHLNASNKLDGEGPFRVVPPQKIPGPPDQPSTAPNNFPIWQWDSNADHNAGYSSRSVTIIKVNPLPAGTTDIDVLEAGWAYIDQAKIVVYGALSPRPVGDLDDDGLVNCADISILKASFGKRTGQPGFNASADITKDGIVDVRDLAVVSRALPAGTKCP